MKQSRLIIWALLVGLSSAPFCLESFRSHLWAAIAPEAETRLQVENLTAPVRLVRDPWGIVHIYAQNQRDLFFAQGFNAARDRLFQLEMWRRSATGTWSELVGARALKHDIGSRLFRMRQDLNDELNFYHPEGREIIGAFVEGINSYIRRAKTDPATLPIEFRLLGIQPGEWTPEVVVSRHNGLYGNLDREFYIASLLSALGAERALELMDLYPERESLELPPGLDLAKLNGEALDMFTLFRTGPGFQPEDVVDPALRAPGKKAPAQTAAARLDFLELGSNNWAVSAGLSLTGRPLLANDPHRAQQIPSLRYFVHLSAPGWNVIGGGEPALPGVAIGHNEHGAWGLTRFYIDQEDLYIYELDPADRNRYRYGQGWEAVTTVQESIPVKGEQDRAVTLKFTRHGPVIWEDPDQPTAYAVRAAWLEVGGAPYLGSLRMDQARNWREFREACAYFLTPGENMVWADRDNRIGWQGVGITPIRKGWEGLLPVPGDGRFEWKGFLDPGLLPHKVDPPEGYLQTANEPTMPADYPHLLGFHWSPPFRASRIHEVLRSSGLMSLADMIELQQDELSVPARILAGLLQRAEAPPGHPAEPARRLLRGWDFRMKAESSQAALYMKWERLLVEQTWDLKTPEPARSLVTRRTLAKTIDWLLSPDHHFGPQPVQARDQLLLSSLAEAFGQMKEEFGPDPQKWRYGQEEFHHIQLLHPLSSALRADRGRALDIGPLARGGNGHTVNNTGDGDNQTSGASFRIVIDVQDWDRSLGTSNPGQSGDPASPHYRDLFEAWAAGSYFPLLYSRDKVEAAAREIVILEGAAQP